jgi:Tfp pilus assembly protein FimT
LNSKKTCKGVTLIELQIVIGIIAITGAIFFSVETIVNKVQIDAVGNQIYTHFSLARSEAFKRGVNVSVCGSNNGTNCNTNNWSDGWLVFTNINSDYIINTNENILAVKQRINTELAITSDNNNRIDFQANGQVLAPRTIIVCRSGVINAWVNIITVDQSGRITKTTDFGNCL